MSDVDSPPTGHDSSHPAMLHYSAVQPRKSGMAIASLVLGLLGILLCPLLGPIFGPIGLVLGIIALRRAHRDPQRYAGRGIAIGGICTSTLASVALLAIPLTIAILLPSFTQARILAKRAVSAANLRGVGTALLVYSSNHGQPPSTLSALVAEGLVAPAQLQNPLSDGRRTCDYFYVRIDPEATPDPRWIAAYDDASDHNGEGANVLYFDGRVDFVMEPLFSADLTGFTSAYHAAVGRDPVIIPPN
jgi:prepilin-type processing-associated H-X9-DG protein